MPLIFRLFSRKLLRDTLFDDLSNASYVTGWNSIEKVVQKCDAGSSLIEFHSYSFKQILKFIYIYQPPFGILIPLILKPRWCNHQTFYVYLYVCPFQPVIQLADQLSPNCSKGLESCKDGMSFSSRQPDLLVPKASKEKSHRDRRGAILSLCHSRLLHNFVHIYKFLEYMNWNKQLVMKLYWISGLRLRSSSTSANVM